MDEPSKLIPRERDAALTTEAPPALPTYYPGWEPGARDLHLRHYLLILAKHRWLILSLVVLVVTGVAIANFRAQSIYEAAARLEIDVENPNILPFQTVASPDFYWDTENYIQTRAKILQSETLALQTIKSVDLEHQPEFSAGPATESSTAQTPTASAEPTERPGILSAFLGRLTVQRIENSRLLEVKFEAHDPVLAARVVNAHLANFIEHNYRTHYDSTVQAANWLSTQLEELKIKVEKSEDALVAYGRQNQIWAIDERQNITTQKLADLNKELTLAQADRVRAEANYQLVRSGNLDALPAVRQSGLIQELFNRRAELNQQHVEALNQFGPKYPKVLRLEAQLQELDSSIAREKLHLADQLAAEYETARQREALLSRALEHQKTEANALAQKLVQYNILKRETETNKNLYDGLLQKIKEAGISAGLRSSNIRVIDPALVPTAPSRPHKMRNLMLALCMGLIGGVGLAFLREYLDNTVKTAQDVEYLTRLPSLVIVPQFATGNGFARWRGVPKLLKSKKEAVANPPVELIAHERPQSPISEAFRTLRTSLLLSRVEHPPQLILVTSTLPQEGKTTSAINLAVTLAQLGDRTLLMDADMRRRGVARALGLDESSEAGLSSFLAGSFSLDQVIKSRPLNSNLAAIPAGPVPPNPAELLSSQRLRDAFDALRREFKFIVIDSPPIMTVTDALILSVLADSVLLVVRSGETPKEALTRTTDLLTSVRCPLLGVVLNSVDFTASRYYYPYSYHYYYSSGGDKPRPPKS